MTARGVRGLPLLWVGVALMAGALLVMSVLLILGV